MSNIADTTRDTVRGVLQMNPQVSPQTVADIDAILSGEKVAVERREAIETPPIKPKNAAKMLGVTTKALLYHARLGRIRRVRVPNSARSLGYVAEDIYRMMRGVAK